MLIKLPAYKQESLKIKAPPMAAEKLSVRKFLSCFQLISYVDNANKQNANKCSASCLLHSLNLRIISNNKEHN